MATQISKEILSESKKKVLATGLLVAGMMAASLLVASPAHASTTFTVNESFDSPDLSPGNGRCDSISFQSGDQCTLRAAIEEANATSGADTINFNIPGSDAQTIRPTSELPDIIDQVTIDGYTQAGAIPNTLAKGTDAKIMVELDGSKAAASNGLKINAPNSVVRGLAINRFSSKGIVLFPQASGSRIEGNFIGTDASGTFDLGNDLGGINVNSGDNTVGGASPEARNLISGNELAGVFMNLTASGNKVLGNLIGTKKDGNSSLGNGRDGVLIDRSPGVTIGDGTTKGANTISFNGRQGVNIFGDTSSIRILSNSIFSNAGLGIDLIGGAQDASGVTANDTGDTDVGPNALQNFPVLSSAKTSKEGTAIAGKLNSIPSKSFKVQLFSNASGTSQGQTFLGEKSVTTDSSGNASFTFKTKKKVAKGQNITATATDSSGNTSEFSAPRTVVRKR